jgi:hypothetical protein
MGRHSSVTSLFPRAQITRIVVNDDLRELSAANMSAPGTVKNPFTSLLPVSLNMYHRPSHGNEWSIRHAGIQDTEEPSTQGIHISVRFMPVLII